MQSALYYFHITIPFLLCMIIVSTIKRNTRRRAIVNWIGIGISSLYMMLTMFNKLHVDRVFEKALANRNIEALRSRTSPTILNNLLWACVAEDKETYYVGLYSIFDTDPNLHYLNVIPKNDSIRLALGDEPEYKTLEWFSDGYLAAFPTDSVTYLCDLRYGGIADTIHDQRDLVFNFKVKQINGVTTFTENRETPKGNIGEIFRALITRMKGY